MSDSFVRWFVAIVTALLVIGTITFGVRLVMPAAAPPTLQPQLATVVRSSFPIAVNATGTVVPVVETPLGFQVDGVVASINVSIGQSVQAGTTLASLQDSAASNAVTQANANLQSAQAALASAQNPSNPGQISELQTALSNAQSNLAQTLSTVQSINANDAQRVQSQQAVVSSAQTSYDNAGCTSQSTLSNCVSLLNNLTAAQQQLSSVQSTQAHDEANGQLQSAQAQATVNTAQATLNSASTPDPNTVSAAQANVTAAQAAVASANAQLSQERLISPVSGTVLQINGEVGQKILGGQPTTLALPGISAPTSALAPSSGGTGSSGLSFIVIGSPNDLVVGFAIPATDLSYVSVGNAAVLTGTATGFTSISGTVRAVSQSTVVLGGVPSYYATVDLSNTKNLKVGESLSVSVTSSQLNNVLSVPSSAIYQLGGAARVDVWTGHTSVPTEVTVGAQGVNMVEITGGLRVGEQVVLVANQGFTQAVTK